MSDLFGNDSQGADELAWALVGRGTREGLRGATRTFDVEKVIDHPSTRALRLVVRGHDTPVWVPDDLAEYVKGLDGQWRVHMPLRKAQELGLA
ncbi:hypothetical protein [Pyruvatibacter sp.]